MSGEKPAAAAAAGEDLAVQQEELPARRLRPNLDLAVQIWCCLVALFVLRQVFSPLSQGGQYYLVLFLAATLPLVFICYRGRARNRGAVGDLERPPALDWVLAGLALIVALYPVLPIPESDLGFGGFGAFLDRQGSLVGGDVIAGLILMVLVLEAARRTTGWVLPIVCLICLAYAFYGGYLPIEWSISHPGLDLSQIVNALYNEASGFFGVPLDVAATYIVLFTIYGAVLGRFGAGRFFVEFSFSLFRRSRSAPGRTVAASGFLLGTVSGSGAATTVTLGSFAWPILKRAGYPREAAGGLLAASGIGAILSPPTLGAAAFIIAEYLSVSYGTVLIWAIIPTLLYYLGVVLAIELDARRFDARAVDLGVGSPWPILLRSGYHLLSLAVIVLFLALGVPPFRAVVYATGIAVMFGLAEALLSRRPPLTDFDQRTEASEPLPLGESLRVFAENLFASLATGVRACLPVIAVCAAAGVITSTIAKTGLGQTLADLLVNAADAIAPNEAVQIVITALFCAFAILLMGLAVPVTASFILSWVIIGPALISLDIEEAAVAMFIFYYAVLSEVSPPTALAAVAAAAITGGRVIATMFQACKYALPAFLAPLAFVVTGNGMLLLTEGAWYDVVWALGASAIAIAALAIATSGWLIGPTGPVVRGMCVIASLLLLYLDRLSIVAGLVLFGLAVVLALVGSRASGVASTPPISES